MHWNTSANIDVVNVNTSTSILIHSNTSTNIEIPHINTSGSVGMHETSVTNYKHFSDSCNALEHVGQASLGMH